MTDLELVKRCAVKMGLEVTEENGWLQFITYHKGYPNYHDYYPLTDDAQAMALVKKFGLLIEGNSIPPTLWRVAGWNNRNITWDDHDNADLNRAIVECVARMP